MRRLKVKICGLREPENVRSVAALNPDYLGFIFYRGSSRYVSVETFPIETQAPRCGVFVNEPHQTLERLVASFKLDAVQLSGSEDFAYIAETKERFPKLQILKSLDLADSPSSFDSLVPLVDLFVFDNKQGSFGGSGEKFNWERLKSYTGSTPYLLSGGIAAQDAKLVKDLASHDSRMLGVDLNSCFEVRPGFKSVELLQQFLSEYRA